MTGDSPPPGPGAPRSADAPRPAARHSVAPWHRISRSHESLRTLTISEGLLLAVLAILALLYPMVASVGVTVMVAVAFLVGGLVGWINILLRAPRLGRQVVLGRVLVATLFVGTGLWMVHQLAAGGPLLEVQVAGLALALGLVFVLEGLVATYVSLTHRRRHGWLWSLANGLVTMVLGLVILTLPGQRLLEVLGLLVGISFLFSALEMLRFSAGFHREEV